MRESKLMRIVCVKQRHPSTPLEPPPPAGGLRVKARPVRRAAAAACARRVVPAAAARRQQQQSPAFLVSRETLSCSRPLTLAALCWCPLRQRHTHNSQPKRRRNSTIRTPPHTLCVQPARVCVRAVFDSNFCFERKKSAQTADFWQRRECRAAVNLFDRDKCVVCLRRVCLLIGSAKFSRSVCVCCVCECVGVVATNRPPVYAAPKICIFC
jgi:hypothetical protein